VEVIDQHHFHGILDRIGGLGLEMVSVESWARDPHHHAGTNPPTADRTSWKG